MKEAIYIVVACFYESSIKFHMQQIKQTHVEFKHIISRKKFSVYKVNRHDSRSSEA